VSGLRHRQGIFTCCAASPFVGGGVAEHKAKRRGQAATLYESSTADTLRTEQPTFEELPTGRPHATMRLSIGKARRVKPEFA